MRAHRVAQRDPAITYGLVQNSTTVTFYAHGDTSVTVEDRPAGSAQHYQATGGATAAQMQLARQLYAHQVAQKYATCSTRSSQMPGSRSRLPVSGRFSQV